MYNRNRGRGTRMLGKQVDLMLRSNLCCSAHLVLCYANYTLSSVHKLFMGQLHLFHYTAQVGKIMQNTARL